MEKPFIVCCDDDGLLRKACEDRLAHEFCRIFVKRGGRFIEQDDRARLKEGAGNAETLSLTGRNRLSAFAKTCKKSLVKGMCTN